MNTTRLAVVGRFLAWLRRFARELLVALFRASPAFRTIGPASSERWPRKPGFVAALLRTTPAFAPRPAQPTARPSAPPRLDQAAVLAAIRAGESLAHADLSLANLIGTDLSRANLSDTDLSDANLSNANVSGADLSDADLSGADLSDANLSRANLSRANLSRGILSGANLSDANLSDANLSDADLSRADLSDARLTGARLGGARLGDADFSGADLSDADLDTENLRGVTWTIETRWPERLAQRIHADSDEISPGTYQVRDGGTQPDFEHVR